MGKGKLLEGAEWDRRPKAGCTGEILKILMLAYTLIILEEKIKYKYEPPETYKCNVDGIEYEYYFTDPELYSGTKQFDDHKQKYKGQAIYWQIMNPKKTEFIVYRVCGDELDLIQSKIKELIQEKAR